MGHLSGFVAAKWSKGLWGFAHKVKEVYRWQMRQKRQSSARGVNVRVVLDSLESHCGLCDCSVGLSEGGYKHERKQIVVLTMK